MAQLKCDRYPFLMVRTSAGPVRFHEGRAEATGKQLEEVRGLGEEFGITEVKQAPAKTGAQRPPAGGKKPTSK